MAFCELLIDENIIVAVSYIEQGPVEWLDSGVLIWVCIWPLIEIQLVFEHFALN
jgi:hypothetical protein